VSASLTFLIGVLVPVANLSSQGGLQGFTMKGSTSALIRRRARSLPALFASYSPFKNGGLPTYVMPLVFAGAPLVNVLFSMWQHPPKTSPNPLLYLGFVLAAAGAGMVLVFQAAVVIWSALTCQRFRLDAKAATSRRTPIYCVGRISLMKTTKHKALVHLPCYSSARQLSLKPAANGRSGAARIATASRKRRVSLSNGPKAGPPLVWKAAGAGGGYSSFAISKGRLYTMGLRGATVNSSSPFDIANGKEVWATPHGEAFRNDRGDGPRGTPTIDGDRLYALGGAGDLSSLDLKTGKVVWTMNVLSKFGGENIKWGISESPLVIGDKVLVNAGGPGASIVALKKTDGTLIWKSQSDEAGYSSAIPVEIGGTTQVIFFTGNRALGLDVSDGKLLWEYKRPSNDVANVATPWCGRIEFYFIRLWHRRRPG
jgi:hypothetical protein